jgi:hypothetical protein
MASTKAFDYAFALVLICCAVLCSAAILFLAWMIWRRLRQRRIHETVAPASPADSASLAVAELFSPLQIEAFQIAKELGYFLGTFGPEPEIDRSKMSADEAREVIFQKHIPRAQRILDGYALRFAPKIQTLVLKFGERGYVNLLIRTLLQDKVKTQKDIVYVRAALVALSHSVDGVRLGALEEK